MPDLTRFAASWLSLLFLLSMMTVTFPLSVGSCLGKLGEEDRLRGGVAMAPVPHNLASSLYYFLLSA